MKKKIIAVGIITTMVVCNSMIAWAANTIVTNGGTDTHDVNGVYELSSGMKDFNQDGVPDVDEDNNNIADDTLDKDGNEDVTTPAGATYSVDISWGDMNFTYKASTTSWDDTAHVYTETGTGTWEPGTEDANKITVTNNSNVGILAKVTYANAGGVYAPVSGHLYNASTGGALVKATRSYQGNTQSVDDAFTLPNAVLNSGTDLKNVSYLQLSGAPTSSWNVSTKIGIVTIKVDYNIG